MTDIGLKTGNHRHTTKYAKRSALLQSCLSKKEKSSNIRAMAKPKFAKLHAKKRSQT
ncbi:hypothetical protein [Rosenbergiella collisarenosi]|uniref:hypothetical protein n=1 Tax=Rosenbergiella collisarenosi TaxID=1544695 RepID=UPI003CC81F8B